MKQALIRWTKRVFISLITLTVVLLAAIAIFFTAERHRMAQFNRTHERPLLVDPSDPVLTSAHQLLNETHVSPSENSLRFAVMPSFGERWFGVSIAEIDGKGVGEAVVETRDPERLLVRKFTMPRAALLRFLGRWDALTDGYSGEGRGLTDGNPLAFERRRADRLTSAEGNSPCHYDVLGDWAAQNLTQYVPELQDLRYPGSDLDEVLKSDFCNRSIFDW